MYMYRNSLNLFNPESEITWHDGYILNDDGNEITSTNSTYTQPFISVNGSTQYSLSGDLSEYSGESAAQGYRVYYYNDNTFLSRSSVLTQYNTTFTTPGTCNKLAIQCQFQNDYPKLNTIMLNTGGKINYEPYNVVDWYTLGYHVRTNSAWSRQTPSKEYTSGEWV